MRELFASLPDEQAPPPPPGYLDTVLVVARRSVRRRRAAMVAAWAAVLLAVVAVAVPVVRAPAQPAAPAARAGLPDRFAGYSTLTAYATGAPAGRAIALYGYGNGEMFNMHQRLVVGADSDTYRRVSAAQDHDLPAALLSPDGTRVLLGNDRSAVTDLLLLDLTTGRQRPIPVGSAPVGVRLLAWSPDGRFVAYSAAPVAANADVTGDSVDVEVARAGTLRILDLATARSTELTAVRPAWTAAFAADSRRLAVQVAGRIHLLALDGAESGTVELPAGRQLVGNVGWSPDGSLFATVPLPIDAQANGNTGHDTYLTEQQPLTFMPVSGTGPAPAGTDAVLLLGWRSARVMLVLDTDAAGRLTIAEADLGDGTRRRLSRFDTGSTCELGTQSCQVFGLQLATGLLPDLTVRHVTSVHRGPWPVWLTVTVAVPVLGVTVLVWWLVRRRRP